MARWLHPANEELNHWAMGLKQRENTARDGLQKISRYWFESAYGVNQITSYVTQKAVGWSVLPSDLFALSHIQYYITHTIKD